MESINGIMEEQKVETFGTVIGAYGGLDRRMLIDGRWLASQPEDSAERKHFIEKEVREISKIGLELGLNDHPDEVDERDMIIAIEELLTFASRLYSRCSDRMRTRLDEYIEETDSD